MGKLSEMKEQLETLVYNELEEDICKINTHELGEVIDMIKDLSEAMYYCSMTKKEETL